MQGPPVFGCRAEPPRRAAGRACGWRVRSPKKEKGSTTKNRGCAAGKWISWMLHTLRAIRKSSRRLSGCVIGRQPYRNTGKKAMWRTLGGRKENSGGAGQIKQSRKRECRPGAFSRSGHPVLTRHHAADVETWGDQRKCKRHGPQRKPCRVAVFMRCMRTDKHHSMSWSSSSRPRHLA